MSIYENIELFGLTETGSQNNLPAPDDETVQAAIREAFDCLTLPLLDTLMVTEVEAFAHGFATLIFRRKKNARKRADELKSKIAALIRAHDGSEIIETELEDAQDAFATAYEIAETLAIQAEEAAQCYQRLTGTVYCPPSDSRTKTRAHMTGAVFEGRALIEQDEKQLAERLAAPKGPRIAVAGNPDWNTSAHVGCVFEWLDKIAAKYPDMVLVTQKRKKGVDKIAMKWAANRNIAIVTFPPNYSAHGKAAAFRANEEIIRYGITGMVCFGSYGPAINLADRAEEQGSHALRIKDIT